MARTIPPEMIARRIAERKRVQSWTRCRLPLENRIPRYFSLERDSHKENEDWPAWLESLSSLVSAPGFLVSRIGRNMNDPEEVLFVTEWIDNESLDAFAASPVYDVYLQALGIIETEDYRAFFTLEPPCSLHRSMRGGNRAIFTIFTLSFPHAISSQNRSIITDNAYGLPIPRNGRLGYRDTIHPAWINEPSLPIDGQLVEDGVLIQKWPQSQIYPRLEVFNSASNNLDSRASWQRQLDRMDPLRVEEVVWDFDHGRGFEADKEEEEEEEEGEDED